MVSEDVNIGPDGKAHKAPVWHTKFWQQVAKFAERDKLKLSTNDDWASCANRFSNLVSISYIVFWNEIANEFMSKNITSRQRYIWKSENDKARFVSLFS